MLNLKYFCINSRINILLKYYDKIISYFKCTITKLVISNRNEASNRKYIYYENIYHEIDIYIL